ncbi:MAG: mechanosensitive ion channel [Thermomicrobiales bacterium]
MDTATTSSSAMLAEVAREIGVIARGLVIAAVVLGLAILLTRLLRGLVQRRPTFGDVPVIGQTLILNAISFVIGLIACTTVLVLWGVTWSTIAAGIGLSTLAIALGMQDVLKSLAGGVVILLERPFQIGDRIRIKDLTGDVVDVRARHIVLRMDDGHVAMAPNGLLFNETYENLSRTEGYAYAIVVSNITGSPAAARERIRALLSEAPELQAAPEIALMPDLRRAIPWKRGPGQPSSSAGRQRQRAIISWNSDTEETALAGLARQLQVHFPEAEIVVRQR